MIQLISNSKMYKDIAKQSIEEEHVHMIHSTKTKKEIVSIICFNDRNKHLR